jgi:hypothetical protein
MVPPTLFFAQWQAICLRVFHFTRYFDALGIDQKAQVIRLNGGPRDRHRRERRTGSAYYVFAFGAK